MVDEKLVMFCEYDRWKRLFPKMLDKRFGAGTMVELASRECRLRLAESIANGTFRFGIPEEKQVPKDDGSMRTVVVLQEYDRCVMTVLLDVYTELYGDLIPDVCKSYQAGLGTPKVLRQVQQRVRTGATGWKLDVSSYFDSVPVGVVESVLKQLDTGSSLDRLLWEFYHDNRVVRGGVVVERYKSLGQGCAFGSLLANLVLAKLDEEVSSVVEVYYRYSDDMLVLGEGSDDALALIEKRLSELGLTLKEEKKKRVDGNGFDFLGGRVSSEGIGLTRKHRTELRKQVRKLCRGKGRDGQRASVRRIQHWLFNGEQSAGDYWLDVLSLESDVRWLDEYCKDQLKALYCGKQNRVTAARKTSNECLAELGWVSLVAVWKEFHRSRQVYDARKRWLLRKKQVEKKECITAEEAEALWSLAREWEGKSALPTRVNEERVWGLQDWEECKQAARLLEQSSVDSDGYYWQSESDPSLVLFKE